LETAAAKTETEEPNVADLMVFSEQHKSGCFHQTTLKKGIDEIKKSQSLYVCIQDICTVWNVYKEALGGLVVDEFRAIAIPIVTPTVNTGFTM